MHRPGTRHRPVVPTLLAGALAAALLGPAQSAGATEQGPHGCVPFGTAQLPPGAPSAGGRIGFEDLPVFHGENAPAAVHLRTATTQFNRFWEFALVDHELLTRPRGADEPWRLAPVPECLWGEIAGISVDDDELVALDHRGWIYTLDNVTQHPFLWNWTSGWGAMLWSGPGRRIPDARSGNWALSVSSPWDNQRFADSHGNEHHIGWAKMTMIPFLAGDGSRIEYADPWLPNDSSYEIGTPHGGRFQAQSLSVSASTTFIMNAYGDMYTRTFDFDTSGSDTVFFRYSWDDQSGKPPAPNLPHAMIDRNTAAIQLPAPDWAQQPKIPGEITSAISIHTLGPGPENRELRVEGARGADTGFWHKYIHADSWEFEATGTELTGTSIENSTVDRSLDTLGPPAPWNLSTMLPTRDTAIDGRLLADLGLPYATVDPRVLDQLGQHAPPSGYRFEVEAFDPAVTTREATVVAPDGVPIPVLLHTADGMRMLPRGPGLDAQPRQMIGAIEIPPERFAARDTDPALEVFVSDWMQGARLSPITLSATEHDLVIR